MMNNGEIIEIPKEILERGARATENILPRKSKGLYEVEFDKFQEWMVDNGVVLINETVLLGYFEEFSGKFAANSLWTKFSMLKKTVLLNQNIDIGKYSKLVAFLKQRSKGYEPKKSKVLTREEVIKFIQEAPNETFLMMKVALLFGVFGDCRREELVNMLIDHIDDRGEVIVVTIPETKTDKKRIFTIIDDETLGSLKLIRKYGSLRPQGLRRYFVNNRNGRCCAQVVGKNTFGKIPATIAKYLNLKGADQYTSHCLRRTSATLLADAGASMTTLKRHGGWRSSSVVEGYLEDSIASKNKVAKLLAGGPSISNTATLQLDGKSVSITGTFNNCSFIVNENK